MTLFRWLKAAVLSALVTTTAAAETPPKRFVDAILLSAFGERPSFSPDGKRIAFIGKSYGDAFEIELSTGRVRNLTGQFPHQGFLRVQYLPSGDYLLTGPRRHAGPNSRIAAEMWLLDRRLRAGLQPLGERLFEGIAVSRRSNLIAWSAFEPQPVLKPGQGWMEVIGSSKMKHYAANITMQNGAPQISDKREIMTAPPPHCQGFAETQDFRDQDRELIFYCGEGQSQGIATVNTLGYRLDTGAYITYRRRPGEYNEAEGIAPDGSWDAVECAKPTSPGLPPLDICKLEMKPDGALTPLVVATQPGSMRSISNPVVSPDGKWLAFQMSERGTGEIGEGMGIYRVRIAD